LIRTFASLLTIAATIAITAPTIGAVPNAPTALAAAVNGSTVTLTWNGPAGVVNVYVLEAGFAPGLSNAANAVVGVAPSYVASNVPPGTYFVRVRAADSSGLGPASNEVVVNVGGACTSAPNAPLLAPPIVNGSTVTLGWRAGSGGCATTSYTLQAGSFPGAANVTAVNAGMQVGLVATAPPNTYYVRVIAHNAFGATVSNEIAVVVGSAPFVMTGSGEAIFNVPTSVTRVRIYATAPAATGKVFSVSINGQLTISERLGIGSRDVPTYDVIHNVPAGARIWIVTSLDPTGLTWSVTAVP
jgi:hypothetical protein